ncbi:retrovirus-related pol polyprotein from transposon TNT 1-94 [Tanacetum coccineum]
MSYSEQTHLVNYPENEITSDSNIIPYSQYLLETQNAAVQDTNSSAQQDAMILSVFEQLSNQVTNCNKVNKDNLIANESLSAELERYKERVKLLEERQNVDLSCPNCLVYLDSGCSKHMTGDRSQLTNFVHKFLGTGQFGNGTDLQRLWDLEVAFRKHTCFVRNPEGVDLLSGSQETNLYTLSIVDMMASSPICLLAEAINKAWYTQNYSLICLRYNKTPYELMQDKKLDLSFFHVFGSLCYPTNDHEDLGKFDAKADIGIFVGYAPAKKGFRIYNRRTLIITETIHVTFDELTTMASEQSSSRPGLYYMTPATSSTGLGSNPVSQQPCLPPKRDDWDHFFQPMFDEYFNPPPITISLVQEAAALRSKVLADSHVSTSIDQDAPSTSIPSSQEHEQSLIISQGFEESPKTPTFHDDPLNESPNEDSTPQGSSSNVRQIHTPFEHLGRWTKDHPIANVIGDPSRSVSTRKQLETDAMWCYFDAFLTSVEPKNFKQAMTELTELS